MPHHLNELNIASLTEEELKKLQEAEKFINRNKGGARKEEIYLIALTRLGR
ncbi:MAG: hypothetical protein QHH75_08490 [Bacillota bacterium]|jgi:hypothetical protein|nr:hypothetical protein [Bacillota bacterium]